jgi:DNA-binding NtrC family response regulator
LSVPFKVLTASEATSAIEAIQEYPGPVDIVITDVRMPGSMDGFGLAAWLKANRPEIGVIVTSGHAQAEDVAQELCDHVGEIVKKPYDFDALAKRVEQALIPAKPSTS